ncbi:MAG: 2-C-methyl-D-erythritol 4-phosphate cytidylyltransferase [Planctomycetota bacterium]
MGPRSGPRIGSFPRPAEEAASGRASLSLSFSSPDAPVLLHALERIRASGTAQAIVIVLPPEKLEAIEAEYGEALRRAGVTTVVPGGESRQASVARGLAALKSTSRLIAVHDAVRPFAGPGLIARLCRAAALHGGAIPVAAVTDTLKRVSQGSVRETVPRRDLVAVQSPQVFERRLFERAYREAPSLGEEVTDDASLVEAVGGCVQAVEGERFNLKITTAEDLSLAEALFASGLV